MYFQKEDKILLQAPSESTKTTAICLVLVSIFKTDKNGVLIMVQQTVYF